MKTFEDDNMYFEIVLKYNKRNFMNIIGNN